MAFDPTQVRRDFPALDEKLYGHPLIYLDNAATAQMPRQVMEAVSGCELRRGNVHRGIHTLAEESTAAYEAARAVAAGFINADPTQVSFTSGATQGVNMVAAAYGRQDSRGVVATVMEHHSNLLPWRSLCAHRPFALSPLLPDGSLDMTALDRLLTHEIGLLAITHCSNVLGVVNPIKEICALAHSRGIKVLVDGAQAICHRKIDAADLGCDWYVCSGHKLGGPFGIGLLYCREQPEPVFLGGGMVERVTDSHVTYAKPPQALEAGTPNVSGAVGLAAAIEYRNKLPAGWEAHEASLLKLAQEQLCQIDGLHILGSGYKEGCISFVIDGVSPMDAAMLLDKLGIALRSGHHCAQPLLNSLGHEYALRISPAFYNTDQELEAMFSALNRVVSILRP